MSNYTDKIEEKRKKYADMAKKAKQESSNAINVVKEIQDMIPFGQPILVGHHSEGKHRRDLQRVDSAYRKSIELDKKAQYYDDKSVNYGNSIISADDEDAIMKLETKRNEILAIREEYKTANKILKKFDITLSLAECPISERLKNEMKSLIKVTPYNVINTDKKGKKYLKFPSYATSTLSAQLMQVKKRIAALTHIKTQTELISVKMENYELIENIDDNRLWFVFDGKPAESIRKLLKSRGFKWSPTRKAWIRMITNAAKYAAKEICEQLNN